MTDWLRALGRLARQECGGRGVLAPVLTQPGLPATRPVALDTSPADLARVQAMPDSAANPAGMKAQGKAPHSVFTVDLIDAPDQPIRRAVDEVIAFFRKALLEEHPAA